MRLIDADALLDIIPYCDANCTTQISKVGAITDMIMLVSEAPTIDAVPVVRCKDCKHYEIHRPKVLENCERNGHLIPMSPDDFCSYGERKSE